MMATNSIITASSMAAEKEYRTTSGINWHKNPHCVKVFFDAMCDKEVQFDSLTSRSQLWYSLVDDFKAQPDRFGALKDATYDQLENKFRGYGKAMERIERNAKAEYSGVNRPTPEQLAYFKAVEVVNRLNELPERTSPHQPKEGTGRMAGGTVGIERSAPGNESPDKDDSEDSSENSDSDEESNTTGRKRVHSYNQRQSNKSAKTTSPEDLIRKKELRYVNNNNMYNNLDVGDHAKVTIHENGAGSEEWKAEMSNVKAEIRDMKSEVSKVKKEASDCRLTLACINTNMQILIQQMNVLIKQGNTKNSREE